MKTARLLIVLLTAALIFPANALATPDIPQSLLLPEIVSAEADDDEVYLTLNIDKDVREARLPQSDYIAINVFWKQDGGWNNAQIYQQNELVEKDGLFVLKCTVSKPPDEVKLRFCYVTGAGHSFSVLKYYDFCEPVAISAAQNAAGTDDVPHSREYSGGSIWAEPELKLAAELGLITVSVSTDLSRNITREEFAELSLLVYNRLTGDIKLSDNAPFSDCNNPFVTRAAELAIVTGTGNNRFNPGGSIMREQVAAMLYRMAKSAKPKFEFTAADTGSFSDAALISSWAAEPMKAVVGSGIMHGNGAKLNPKGFASREQSVIMCLRAYLKLK